MRGGRTTHEVVDEVLTERLPRGDGPLGQVHEPGESGAHEGHGEPIRHALVITLGSLNAEAVELEEVCRRVFCPKKGTLKKGSNTRG